MFQFRDAEFAEKGKYSRQAALRIQESLLSCPRMLADSTASGSLEAGLWTHAKCRQP